MRQQFHRFCDFISISENDNLDDVTDLPLVENTIKIVLVIDCFSVYLKDDVAKQLLGTWNMVEVEQNGEKRKTPGFTFTFNEDNTVEQTVAGRSQTSKYKLDPDNPKHLDLTQERARRQRTFGQPMAAHRIR